MENQKLQAYYSSTKIPNQNFICKSADGNYVPFKVID